MAVPSGHPLSCYISRSRPMTARPSSEGRGRCLCDPSKIYCSDLVHGVCVCVICQACTPQQWVLRTAHVPHQHLATVEPTCRTKQVWAGADPCPAAQLPGQTPALPPTEPGRGTTSPKTIPRRKSPDPPGRPHSVLLCLTPGSSSCCQADLPCPAHRESLQHDPFPD